MATFNSSHHENGGVVLFSGELVLLFCDNVNVSIQGRDDANGKLFLTTHRMVFINKDIRQNLKSFSAPFFSMHDLSLEQPIFGANYIKGKVREQSNNSVGFKLKFSSGGAIEYGKALEAAAHRTQNMAQQFPFTPPPPPPYSPGASNYYQAPPNIYQPAYNCGFNLPTNIFNQPPPAGFIYAMDAPPPYPGLNPQQQSQSAGPLPSKDGSGPPPNTGGYPYNPAPYGGTPEQPPAYSAPAPGFGNIYPNVQPGAPAGQPYGYNPQQPGFAPAGGGGFYPGAQQPNQTPPAYPGPNPAVPSAYPTLPTSQPASNPGFQPGSNPAYPGSQPAYPPISQSSNQQSPYPNIFANANAPPPQ